MFVYILSSRTMMSIEAIGKTKSYNKREFHRILLNNGFELVRTRGSHYVFKRGDEEIVTNKDINKMIIRRLIKTHNLQFK